MTNPDDEEVRPCPRCRGTGFEDEYENIPCIPCGGTGDVPA